MHGGHSDIQHAPACPEKASSGLVGRLGLLCDHMLSALVTSLCHPLAYRRGTSLPPDPDPSLSTEGARIRWPGPSASSALPRPRCWAAGGWKPQCL